MSFGRNLERLGLQLAVLFEKNFYLAFRFFQFFAARIRKLNAFFKQFERLFQRNFTALQLVDDFFEPLQAFFEFGQGLTSN